MFFRRQKKETTTVNPETSAEKTPTIEAQAKESPTKKTPAQKRTQPKPKKQGKQSASDFTPRFLCHHPDATVEQVQKALAEKGLKMNEWVIGDWIRGVRRIFDELEKMGKLKS